MQASLESLEEVNLTPGGGKPGGVLAKHEKSQSLICNIGTQASLDSLEEVDLSLGGCKPGAALARASEDSALASASLTLPPAASMSLGRSVSVPSSEGSTAEAVLLEAWRNRQLSTDSTSDEVELGPMIGRGG